MNAQRCQKRNRTSGSSLAELAAALVLMTPILLLMIDCLSICIGTAINDSVCRDAARAAASGPPAVASVGNRSVAMGQAPYARAQTVIKNVYQTNLPMKIRDAITVSE